MSRGFVKLDSGILESSIMTERPAVFKVFISLLAACDPDGLARVSSVYLCSVCRLSQKEIDRALERLSSPDPNSRSRGEEGRRIKRVDGGWLVINYRRYREHNYYSTSPEACRKRRYRAGKTTSSSNNIEEEAEAYTSEVSQNVPRMSHSTPSESGTPCDSPRENTPFSESSGVAEKSSAMSSEKSSEVFEKSSARGYGDAFEAWWSGYPRKESKEDACDAFRLALSPKRQEEAPATVEELTAARDAYAAKVRERGTEPDYIKLPSTFLRKNRWRDYLPKPKPTVEEWEARQAAELKELNGQGERR